MKFEGKSLLTGVTLIRNGNDLKYPWKESLKSMSLVCDTVWLNLAESDDDTEEEALLLAEELGNIKISHTKWDTTNTGDGRELAKQVNNILRMVSYANSEWILYLQADELIHHKDAVLLRQFLRSQPKQINRVELYRTYFWKDLEHQAPKYEIWLGRVFRNKTHIVGGDGMYTTTLSGDIPGQQVRSPFWIYHYSRMGKEEDVNHRLRNLDGFFHPPEVVKSFKPFSYNEVKELVEYTGDHPFGIKEFYSK